MKDKLKDRVLLKTLLIPALLYKRIHKPLWLLSSRFDEADGNALALYKWSQKQNLDRKLLFVVDKNNPQFEKGMIPWGSLKHFFYALVCEAVLFDADNCNDFCFNTKEELGIKEYRVFLQHGVIVSYIPGYIREATSFDLFMCSLKKEFFYLRDVYGYSENSLALTGLARHDDLISSAKDDKYIFVAPTWRNYFKDISEEEFVSSDYFKKWNSLLEKIVVFAKSNHLKVRFQLHYMIKRFQKCFINYDEIIYSKTDSIHELIRDCSLMITDYSSMSIDAALIHKSIIYYQFDYNDYRSKHQGQGYFDYEQDGFGPVVSDEEAVLETTKNLWTGNHFWTEETYVNRSNHFFEFFDTDNCQRNYDAVKGMIDNQ